MGGAKRSRKDQEQVISTSSVVRVGLFVVPLIAAGSVRLSAPSARPLAEGHRDPIVRLVPSPSGKLVAVQHRGDTGNGQPPWGAVGDLGSAWVRSVFRQRHRTTYLVDWLSDETLAMVELQQPPVATLVYARVVGPGNERRIPLRPPGDVTAASAKVHNPGVWTRGRADPRKGRLYMNFQPRGYREVHVELLYVMKKNGRILKRIKGGDFLLGLQHRRKRGGVWLVMGRFPRGRTTRLFVVLRGEPTGRPTRVGQTLMGRPWGFAVGENTYAVFGLAGQKDRAIEVRPCDGRGRRRRFRADETPRRLFWSSEGRFLYYLTASSIHRINIRTRGDAVVARSDGTWRVTSAVPLDRRFRRWVATDPSAERVCVVEPGKGVVAFLRDKGK